MYGLCLWNWHQERTQRCKKRPERQTDTTRPDHWQYNLGRNPEPTHVAVKNCIDEFNLSCLLVLILLRHVNYFVHLLFVLVFIEPSYPGIEPGFSFRLPFFSAFSHKSPSGVLTIWRENPEISVWSQMVRYFSGNSVRKLWSTFRGTPLFPFGTERRKFPYHLLNFPVSRLSSAENNYGKSKCKW